MCRSADTGREYLNRDKEASSGRAGVEEELREREERDEAPCRGVSSDAGPDGIQARDNYEP